MDVLLELRCGQCSCAFYVCPAHFRGHRYCSVLCSEASRRLKKQCYQRCYRRTFEGRLNRADLERERRRRRAAQNRSETLSRNFVDDHTSPAGHESATVTPPFDPLLESTKTEVSHVATSRRPMPQNCVVCGRSDPFILPFGEIWIRRRRTGRGPP